MYTIVTIGAYRIQSKSPALISGNKSSIVCSDMVYMLREMTIMTACTMYNIIVPTLQLDDSDIYGTSVYIVYIIMVEFQWKSCNYM